MSGRLHHRRARAKLAGVLAGGSEKRDSTGVCFAPLASEWHACVLCLSVCLAVASTACGGDDRGATPDAAPVSNDAVVELVTPVAPEPPSFVPCPEGWQETEIADVTVCRPWADPPGECPAGRARFVGGEGCRPIGHVCEGRWPRESALPDATRTILYVDAENGSFSGRGGSLDPFVFLDDALRAATAGTTIVLAPGTYREQVLLQDGVSLIGACAERVIIEAPDLADDDIPVAPGVVTVIGTNVHVGGLTLRGRRIGLRVEPTGVSADATVHGVLIDQSAYIGLLVAFGATAVGSDIVVRGTTGVGTELGGGIQIGRQSQATLTDVVVDQTTVSGMGVEGQLDLERAVIRRTGAYPNGRFGRGLNVSANAVVAVRNSIIRENHECALAVDDGRLNLENVVLEGSPDARGRFACGGFVRGRASLAASKLWIDNMENHGLSSSVEAALELEDVVITNTRHSPTSLVTGWGIAASSGTLNANRVRIHNAAGVAMWLDEGVEAEVNDALISATSMHDVIGIGYAMQVAEGASLLAERLRFDDSIGSAFAAFGQGTEARLRDVEVRGAAPSSCDDCSDAGPGTGIAAVIGASVELARFQISGTVCGAQSTGASTLQLTDGQIVENEIGLCIDSPDFQLDELSGVHFGGTPQRNLDRSTRGSIAAALPGELGGET